MNRLQTKYNDQVKKELENELAIGNVHQIPKIEKIVLNSGVGKAEIAQAQAALTKLGLDPGPPDGVAGPKTKAALAQYLAREGLPPSDRVTPEIYRRLVP